MHRLPAGATGQRFTRSRVATIPLTLFLLLSWGCRIELHRPDLRALDAAGEQATKQADDAHGDAQVERCFEEVRARTTPPSGGYWKFHGPDPDNQRCSYFRLLSKEEAGPGHPHTAVAELAGYDDEAFGSLHDDAARTALGAATRSQWSADRFQILSFESSEESFRTATCVEYQATVEDHAVPGFSGEVFEMRISGRRCRHPQDPARIVDVSYSQRFRQGGVWLHLADAAAQPFLSDLEFLPRAP